MNSSMRDCALVLAVGLLATRQLQDALAAGGRAQELRCTKLTVVDSEGRPRVVVDGSPLQSGAHLSVLDSAGTARATMALEQEPNDTLIDSSVKFCLFDHEGVLALELIEEGNHHHGRSSRLDLYSRDQDGKAEWTTMLGTQPLQGWPVLEISPEGGGHIRLGLGDFGIPVLLMRQSPVQPGVPPDLVADRKPEDIGEFSLAPGGKHGQVLVGGEQQVVTGPIDK